MPLVLHAEGPLWSSGFACSADPIAPRAGPSMGSPARLSRWLPDQGQTLGQWREVTLGVARARTGLAVPLCPGGECSRAPTSATIPGGAVPPRPAPLSKGSIPAAEL